MAAAWTFALLWLSSVLEVQLQYSHLRSGNKKLQNCPLAAETVTTHVSVMLWWLNSIITYLFYLPKRIQELLLWLFLIFWKLYKSIGISKIVFLIIICGDPEISWMRFCTNFLSEAEKLKFRVLQHYESNYFYVREIQQKFVNKIFPTKFYVFQLLMQNYSRNNAIYK